MLETEAVPKKKMPSAKSKEACVWLEARPAGYPFERPARHSS